MWGKSNVFFTRLKTIVADAKIVIATGSIILAAGTGAYTIAGEYFVTKVYADELVSKVNNDLRELKKQTSTNKKILTEMRMIRIESKMGRGETLTPTEKRVYEHLKKEFDLYDIKY